MYQLNQSQVAPVNLIVNRVTFLISLVSSAISFTVLSLYRLNRR